jgi:hypothetical protein
LQQWIAKRLGFVGAGPADPFNADDPDAEWIAWRGKVGESPYHHLSNWPGSTDAALTLPMPYVMRVEMVRYPYDANYVTLECRRVFNGVTVMQEFDGECDGGPEKLGRAVCIAWCKMMQAWEGEADNA